MSYLDEPRAGAAPYDLSEEKRGPDDDTGFGNLKQEDMVNVDNFYEYDETNQAYSPMVQPFSYFYVGIAGQIEYGDFLNMDGLAIKYAFVAGDDWQLANGQEEGQG